MYKCPNCGGELEFRPDDQIIRCEYCNSEFKPDELKEEAEAKSAEAQKMVEGTVYTCSQCGGQIICNDDTGVTFCSYCGSQAMISEKIEAEQPDYIIPFSITKEKCEKIYRDKIKKAWFLPKDFKKETTIEKFRGIYMPYWIFSGRGNYLQTVKTEQYYSSIEHGKQYDITNYYDMDINADSYYDGIIFDASSSLPDDVAENVLPYDMRSAKDFDSVYMTGFYTDVGDVPEDIYFTKTEKIIKHWITESIVSDPSVKNHGKLTTGIDESYMDVKLFKPKRGYFPVWFLSVKNPSGEMSYAVVNGVSGKMHMDLPIDYKKYLLLSLCIAVPVFLILLLFTMVPKVLLGLVMLFLAISAFVSIRGVDEIYIRKHSLNDWGKRYAENMDMPEIKEKNPQKTTGSKKSGCSMALLFIALPIILAIISRLTGLNIYSILLPLVFVVVIIAFVVTSIIKNKTKTSDSAFEYKVPAFAKVMALIPSFVGILIAGAVMIIAPASDLYYYLATIVCIAILCVIVFLQVKARNALALRKPAQLGKRGGDEVE